MEAINNEVFKRLNERKESRPVQPYIYAFTERDWASDLPLGLELKLFGLE
jgi:hypothetical protein